jgi:hypothetical protein
MIATTIEIETHTVEVARPLEQGTANVVIDPQDASSEGAPNNLARRAAIRGVPVPNEAAGLRVITIELERRTSLADRPLRVESHRQSQQRPSTNPPRVLELVPKRETRTTSRVPLEALDPFSEFSVELCKSSRSKRRSQKGRRRRRRAVTRINTSKFMVTVRGIKSINRFSGPSIVVSESHTFVPTRCLADIVSVPRGGDHSKPPFGGVCGQNRRTGFQRKVAHRQRAQAARPAKLATDPRRERNDAVSMPSNKGVYCPEDREELTTRQNKERNMYTIMLKLFPRTNASAKKLKPG